MFNPGDFFNKSGTTFLEEAMAAGEVIANVPVAGNSCAIYFAFMTGREDCIHILLAKGERPDFIDINGNNAYHHIAAKNMPNLIASLAVDNPQINMNGENEHGRTPLMVASITNHIEVVKEIIALGSEPWSKNADGDNALTLSARAMAPEVLSYLLELGGEVNEIAKVACKHNNPEMTKVIGKYSGKLNCENRKIYNDLRLKHLFT